MRLDYTFIEHLNIWRPYVYVRLLNSPAKRTSTLISMVLDTGSDHCLFDAALAHAIGINPMEGGQSSGTTGVGGSTPTALWPIELVVPELGNQLFVMAQFGLLPPGINGLLGNHGFLDHFESACFFPRAHEFELASVS